MFKKLITRYKTRRLNARRDNLTEELNNMYQLRKHFENREPELIELIEAVNADLRNLQVQS